MHQITSLLQFPDQTPVDAVQGTITNVYERRTLETKFGPKTTQSATLKDVAGNSIRVSCWEHPALEPLLNKEVVLHSTNGKGVKVKHGSYTAKKGDKAGQVVKTVELDVSKAGVFQFVEVYNQTTGASAPTIPANAPSAALAGQSGPTPGVHTPQAGSAVKIDSRPTPVVFGATVGMAINCACANLTARGQSLDPKAVWVVASDIIRVAQALEQGKLHVNKPTEVEAKVVEPEHVEPEAVPAKATEDVPY